MPEDIHVDNTRNYTIPANSEVVVPNAITFEQDGKVVAKVSATYDTKDLPPELHQLFFQLVDRHCHRLMLPSALPRSRGRRRNRRSGGGRGDLVLELSGVDHEAQSRPFPECRTEDLDEVVAHANGLEGPSQLVYLGRGKGHLEALDLPSPPLRRIRLSHQGPVLCDVPIGDDEDVPTLNVAKW